MARERTTILLIDDNETDAWIVRSLLGECGNFEVIHIARFEDAAEQIARTRIDAALFDPSLKGTDSLESGVRFLQSHGFDAPIIVFSRFKNTDALVAREVVRAGADDLLPKAQVDGGTIRRTIFTAIERTRRERTRLAEMRASLKDAYGMAKGSGFAGLLPAPVSTSPAAPASAAA